MEKHYDMEPGPFKGMNKTIVGRGLTEAEIASGEFLGDHVYGLPVMETSIGYVSRWRCKSIYWRLVFLFTGRLNLKVSCAKHPPVSIYIGHP